MEEIQNNFPICQRFRGVKWLIFFWTLFILLPKVSKKFGKLVDGPFRFFAVTVTFPLYAPLVNQSTMVKPVFVKNFIRLNDCC